MDKLVATFPKMGRIANKNISIQTVIAVAITILEVGFLLWRFSSWYYDDPFITYRYTWNLIHGLGFVYNPGERVLSTTTPLFTLLLTGFGFLGVDIPKTATIIGAVCSGLSGLIFWDIARQWKMNIAGWAGLLLLPSFPLVASTISSETPLYIALALGALDGFTHRRYRLTALLAALLVLTRPDGIILPVLLVIFFLMEKRGPIPRMAIGMFLMIILFWFGFAWIYFGSPIPVSLVAKQQQGIMTISQRFAPGFINMIETKYIRDTKITDLFIRKKVFILQLFCIFSSSLGCPPERA